MLRVDEPAGQAEQMADPVLFENFPVDMNFILIYVLKLRNKHVIPEHFTTDYLE